MITARTTELVRVPDLRAFRQAIVERACAGTPFDIHDRLLIVPTRSAAAYLTRSIERRWLRPNGAVALPGFATRSELYGTLSQRLSRAPLPLTAAEREVLMGVACRQAQDEAAEPPFRLRPSLVAEIVELYDTLRRNLKQVDTFERLAVGMLEPSVPDDRGAERLMRQTQFLVAAFRRFERLCQETAGADEHLLRQALLAASPSRPWRHVVVAVGDQTSDAHGLFPADWDLLARIHGLERLDVIVTEAVLAGALHERIHQLLPGIEEVRPDHHESSPLPVLITPSGGALVHTARDREEEVAGFARWVRREARELDRTALVVRRPLPYVYLARSVLTSAGIPSQMFDALPLAAEPFAAALDLVFAFVTSNFARGPGIALLRSPHLVVGSDDSEAMHAIDRLDRALSDAGYLGGIDVLERLVAAWDAHESAVRLPQAGRQFARRLLEAAQELAPLRAPAPCAEQLDRLIGFLGAHERRPVEEDPLRARLLRARGAVLEVLAGLHYAYARFDTTPIDLDTLAPVVRRWIDERTFAPYTGQDGVHVVDADAARFGDFDAVQLAGLVDREWPEGPRRNIFYPPGLLRELGWPSEAQRLDQVRSSFMDLLQLPSAQLVVSTFTLEDDVVVSPSPLLDALEKPGLITKVVSVPVVRVFDHEALSLNPIELEYVGDLTRAAAMRRVAASGVQRESRAVAEGARPLPAYAVSALERYQDCPFRFFAADILRLEEPPEDEPTLSPRARGKFLHELFQRFFEAWDSQGDGTITVERVDDARALFEEVAAPMLLRLSDAESALERARLFGSAASMGIVDTVLGLEASRPGAVRERWLEYRLEGDFSLGASDGRQVVLKGVADRVDLLAGNRIRVIDYKSGYPPNPKRALQAAVYALCAQDRLEARGDGTWMVDEVAYIAFSGKRTVVPVVRAASDGETVLASARSRVLDVLDGVEQGVFPPRPHDVRLCVHCAYPSVCRKDYVGDE